MVQMLRFFGMVILIMLPSILQGTAPSILNYQGRLSDAGERPADGTFDLTFTIYDAPTAGNVLWTEIQPSVVVTNGLFSIMLGFTNPLSASIFSDSVRYLGIRVGTDPEIMPRSRLASVGYALTSTYADSAGKGDFWSTDGTNVFRTSGRVGIRTSSPQASLDIQDGNIRLYQYSGVNPPALSITQHSNVAEPNQVALEITGGVTDVTPAHFRIYTAGDPWALRMRHEGSAYFNQIGIATSDPKSTLDVFGPMVILGATNNQSVRPAIGPGVITGEVRAYSQNGFTADDGLLRLSAGGGTNWGTKTYIDLSGFSTQPDMYQNIVFGTGNQERARLTADGFFGIGTSSPIAKLHVVGDLCVTGQKNAIVPTSLGMTKVYSEESAECWFTDYGEAQLSDGRAVVSLDRLFLETVLIDIDHPMQVFLQEYEESNGLIVTRHDTNFEVCEKHGGQSNARFSYRIVAKRKGQENVRLQTAKEETVNAK